jgi:hypothetical protein
MKEKMNKLELEVTRVSNLNEALIEVKLKLIRGT